MNIKLVIVCLILGSMSAHAEIGQHPDPKLCGNHISPYKASMSVVKTDGVSRVTLTIKARSTSSQPISVELLNKVSNKPVPGTLRTGVKALRNEGDTVINWSLEQQMVPGGLKAIIRFDGHGSHGHLVVTDRIYKPTVIKMARPFEARGVDFKGMQLNRTFALTPAKYNK
ncbi:MAG: hypothetical protein ACPGQS_10265 [Bradymonadia bacterium]